MNDDREPGREDRASAALLRHDLIVPVNQILGYVDLLIDDARDQGRSYRAMSLRSIQAMGRRALEAIDDVLIRSPERGRPPDLAALRSGVAGPSESIVEACRALEEASAQVPDRASFLDDLARVRDAAASLGELARRVADPAA